MRLLSLLLMVLIVLLQYSLWLGKGSWMRVWELDRQITKQTETNSEKKARNDAMEADVRDLKTGYGAIEERARTELGMIKQDEIFFEILNSKPDPNNSTPH